MSQGPFIESVPTESPNREENAKQQSAFCSVAMKNTSENLSLENKKKLLSALLDDAENDRVSCIGKDSILHKSLFWQACDDVGVRPEDIDSESLLKELGGEIRKIIIFDGKIYGYKELASFVNKFYKV